MDLGCGHGLLGIAALKNGASLCCFQDYNQDVLQNITKPNTIINDIDTNRCQFVSGDWDNLISNTNTNTNANIKYDIILGS